MAKAFDRIRAFFNISSKKTNNIQSLTPGNYNPDSGKVEPVQFSDEIQRLLKYWMSDTLDSSSTLKNREGRVKELSYAYYNSPIFSRAVHLYCDEALQADSQNKIIQVYAKKKEVETFINDFFNSVGIDLGALKATAFDLALYSDHFWSLDTSEAEGIKKIIPIDILAVKDRVEFNALRYTKERNFNMFRNLGNRMAVLAGILQNINKDTTNYSEYFKNYLFGYKLETDLVVPPWNILHFRIMTHASEFYPFGRPLLINCLSPFKQLQSTKNLMAVSRANNFPLKIFKVKVDENMSPMDQWNAVNKARQQYENTMGSSAKEQFGVAGELWVPMESLEVQVEDTSVDTDKIADVEFLRNELADGAGIPQDYLSTSTSSWGASGKSLVQQSKIFSRSVYTLQTAIIDALTDLVKMQMILTGAFTPDEEFEISLNFPAVEEDDDKRRSKTDSLELVKAVISTFQELFGVTEEPLPTEVVRDILNKLSFLDGEDIDNYITEIEKLVKEKQASEAEDGGGESENFDDFDESARRINRRAKIQEMRKRITESRVREVYFLNKKLNNLTEGVIGKRHYKSSFVESHTSLGPMFETIKEFSKREDGKLQG